MSLGDEALCQARAPSARQLTFARDEPGDVYIQGLRGAAWYIHGFVVTVYIHGLLLTVYIHGLEIVTVYIHGLLEWAGVAYIHGRLPTLQDVAETTPE